MYLALDECMAQFLPPPPPYHHTLSQSCHHISGWWWGQCALGDHNSSNSSSPPPPCADQLCPLFPCYISRSLLGKSQNIDMLAAAPFTWAQISSIVFSSHWCGGVSRWHEQFHLPWHQSDTPWQCLVTHTVQPLFDEDGMVSYISSFPSTTVQ